MLHRSGGSRLQRSPAAEFAEIWPLHLLDVADDEQLDLLLRLLARLPQLVEHYLSNFIFPQTMLHQTVKLSATAQELGGDLIFKVRRSNPSPSPGTCQWRISSSIRLVGVAYDSWA